MTILIYMVNSYLSEFKKVEKEESERIFFK